MNEFKDSSLAQLFKLLIVYQYNFKWNFPKINGTFHGRKWRFNCFFKASAPSGNICTCPFYPIITTMNKKLKSHHYVYVFVEMFCKDSTKAATRAPLATWHFLCFIIWRERECELKDLHSQFDLFTSNDQLNKSFSCLFSVFIPRAIALLPSFSDLVGVN